VRYKVRLVVQNISQKSGVDYDETYSLVVDAITLQYFVSLVICEKIDKCLMDIVITYLYWCLDNDIYMKISEGFSIPDVYNSGPCRNYSIKLRKLLYGLKQFGHICV
jgi:hypothetical protein